MKSENPRIPWLRSLKLAAVSLAVVACSSSAEGPGTQSAGGSGGAGTTTGGAPGGSGGLGSGGAGTASGGVSGGAGGLGSGGATGLGGNPRSGGSLGSGGAVLGGTNGSGGAAASGGATRSDGASGTGGSGAGGASTTVPGRGGADAGASAGAGGSGAGGRVDALGAGGAAGAGGGIAAGGSTGSCPAVDFGTWPTGKGPADIGKLAVNNFKPHTGDDYGGAGYAWTFAYFGSLQFTQLTGDTSNNDYLVSKFDCNQAGPDNGASASVDTRAFGDLPLEIYLEKQTAACKTLGLARADAQWASTTSDGITKDARYWIDDMYMITGLQVFAYRATKDSKYLDRAAKTMQAYLAALQQSDGLFWHTKTAKAYWGRANGWVASGMTELLLELPAGTARDAIMAGFKKQIDGLVPLQVTSGADAGCWRQVLDRTDASAESSCTAMFTFALVTGLKNGWLTDAKYLTAARNGWTALANKTNSTGMLDKVCPGTGAAPSGDLATQQKYYMDIRLGSNDQHGQAPLLWSATALLRSDCRGLR
jgi:unsaturated rhamnogalacturonyl hydrolase